MYIHERDNWTNFRWDASEVSILQEVVCRKQGLLYGRLSTLGFNSKLRAMAENLTHDVVYSSEIEGICLNEEQTPASLDKWVESLVSSGRWGVGNDTWNIAGI